MKRSSRATYCRPDSGRESDSRALYGDPRLLVLDEPNSNLDKDGEIALANTLAMLKLARRTVLVVTHRKNVLGLVDRILLLVDGQVAAYGERDKVLATLHQAASRAAAGVPAPAEAMRAG